MSTQGLGIKTQAWLTLLCVKRNECQGPDLLIPWSTVILEKPTDFKPV
jgi:hypothetical protein